MSLILENLENYLFSCWDSIGLLLMIKVSQLQQYLFLERPSNLVGVDI